MIYILIACAKPEDLLIYYFETRCFFVLLLYKIL